MSLIDFSRYCAEACDKYKEQYGHISEEAYASLKEQFLSNKESMCQMFGLADLDQYVDEADRLFAALRDETLGKRLRDNYFMAFKIVSQLLTDPRPVGHVTYPLATMIMIMLMAKFLGLSTASEIVKIYNTRNLIFQLLIP